ncbi:hypothetical protein G6F23_015380 [Rhizopus arrhizus]|nr:hypothetical protein G6F23_015380 [Rhizopus arrhizus]
MAPAPSMTTTWPPCPGAAPPRAASGAAAICRMNWPWARAGTCWPGCAGTASGMRIAWVAAAWRATTSAGGWAAPSACARG